MNARREQRAEAVQNPATNAVRMAADALNSLRDRDGYWSAPVHSGGTLECDRILLQLWLDPSGLSTNTESARPPLHRQLPDGGFNIYPDGPADLDATIKAYVALKASGVPVSDSGMQSARSAILALGGIGAASDAVKLTLSFFGLFPRAACPAAPPEAMLQKDAPAGEYAALSILNGLNVRHAVAFDVAELFSTDIPAPSSPWSVVAADRVGRIAGFLRRKALREAEARMLRRAVSMHVIMALDALGYPPEHPLRVPAQKRFTTLADPVRQTATAAFALAESGFDPGHSLCQDSGADLDTTAMVMLSGAAAHVNVLLSRQSRDGGWAAFDGDPSAADTTGRVIEALCRFGVPKDDPAIVKAVEYLFRAQEQDGSWSGRCGVNYLYGTCFALRGLQAAGVSDREAPVLRGGEWIRSVQNADGGWGESCASYSEGTYIPAASTPSQTAWAVLGLLAGGDETSLSVSKGIEYLVETQLGDGTWDERLPTVTGVPKTVYWTDPLYRISFPLLALSSFLKTRREVAHS